MKYTLLEHLSPNDLSELVTKYLEMGWVLYGQPFTDSTGYFYQAITFTN